MREKRFSLASRLIHWAIAFTFLYLLITVLLRSGWLSRFEVANAAQQSLAKDGVAITQDQAEGIGRAVRNPMWNTHIIAGYVMVGLYLIRIIITWVQGLTFANPLKGGLSGYQKFKSWIYIIFYICLAISLITGLLTVFGSHEVHEVAEGIHKLGMYYVVTFIVMHIGGVLLADSGKERGIISKIITGDRP